MIPFNHSAKQGDNIIFGSYAPEGQQKLPVSWKVLDVREDRMLVLAEQVLDLQPFHNTVDITRWENSSLRTWLNGHFLQNAFSPAERELIYVPAKNEDPAGDILWQMFGMETTTDTIDDRIFLLNAADIDTYYPSGDLFHAGISATAAENVVDADNDSLCWWLRSSMNQHSAALIVSPCDSVGFSAIDPMNRQGVRPAMWLRKI